MTRRFIQRLDNFEIKKFAYAVNLLLHSMDSYLFYRSKSMTSSVCFETDVEKRIEFCNDVTMTFCCYYCVLFIINRRREPMPTIKAWRQ